MMSASASSASKRRKSHSSNKFQERVPLLSQTEGNHRYDDSSNNEEHTERRPSSSNPPGLTTDHHQNSKKYSTPWPTVAAIALLFLLILAFMLSGYILPTMIKSYAHEALLIEPSKLSNISFTASGLTAQIQADFEMDASRVQNRYVREIGRLGTWIIEKVESQESRVDVFLPEYGDVYVGTVTIPRILVDIRNHHNTQLNFPIEIDLGDVNGIQKFVHDSLDSHLDQIRVVGKAKISLKSGIFSLGTQSISKMIVLKGNGRPKIPHYDVTKLNFWEIPISPNGRQSIAANISVSVENKYPVELETPTILFEILIPGCTADDLIELDTVAVAPTHINPYQRAIFEADTIIRNLSESLLRPCLEHELSPLEILLDDFIHGKNTTVFVRGSRSPGGDIPDWISRIISSVTVPISFHGQTLDGIIRNFSITDTQFSLPDIFAEPGSEEADPHISGRIDAIARIPREINFSFNISKVRANSHVFYNQEKLGDLNIQKWQKATSKPLEQKDRDESEIHISTYVENARVSITDKRVFSSLIKALLLEQEPISLQIKALVDVQMSTILGEFSARDLPAEGKVPVFGSMLFPRIMS